MGEDGGAGMYTIGGSYAVAAVSALIGVAIQMGYFVYLESSRGQTVGKMIMKLRTVAPDGGNPTVEEAARRNSFIRHRPARPDPRHRWSSAASSRWSP